MSPQPHPPYYVGIWRLCFCLLICYCVITVSWSLFGRYVSKKTKCRLPLALFFNPLLLSSVSSSPYCCNWTSLLSYGCWNTGFLLTLFDQSVFDANTSSQPTCCL